MTISRIILLLNASAAIMYFTVLIGGGFFTQPEFIFSAPDSESYYYMGLWLFGLGNNPSNTRPFLYPFILETLILIGGIRLIVIGQGLLWLSGINSIAYGSFLLSHRSKSILVLSFLMAMSNISLIIYSFQALSETLAFSLLGLWLLVYAHSIVSTQRRMWNAFGLIVMSAAAVTRPVFLPLYYLLLLQTLFAPSRRPKSKFGILVVTLVTMCPILIQVLLMQKAFATLTFSAIGSITFTQYYLAAFQMQITQGITLESARAIVSEMSNQDIFFLLLKFPISAGLFFFYLVISQNILVPTGTIQPSIYPLLTDFTKSMNHFYALSFLLSLFLLIYLRLKRISHPLLLPFICSCWLIGSAGISFWQGDRLIAPAVPLLVTTCLLLLDRQFRIDVSREPTFYRH